MQNYTTNYNWEFDDDTSESIWRRLNFAPDYVKPYSFEVYNAEGWYTWMAKYWWISFPLSTIYVVLILVGRSLMEGREPFILRKPLLVWNILLAVGSWFIFIRSGAETWEEMRSHGFYHTICNCDNHTVVSSFWHLVLTMSKILEFGDTAFIVLRKQKMIFLHPFHHVTVALYMFSTFAPFFDPAGRIFGPSNAFIHFLMYGYYAAKSMRIKIPIGVAKGITSLQILQMVMGIWVNVLSLVGMGVWSDCNRPLWNTLWGLVMYGSYLGLFLQFYYSSYGTIRSKRMDKTK